MVDPIPVVQPVPQTPPPPPPPLPPKTPVSTIVLSILLVVVIIGAILILIFFDNITSQPFAQNWIKGLPITSQENIILPSTPHTPTPKPTPSYLHPGKETYNIGKNTVGDTPKINSLTLDPLDVKPGDQQIIDVTVSSTSPVQTVDITLYADDKNKQTVSLSQSSTTATSSTWRGTWTIQSSVLYRYVVMITAKNSSGENKSYVAVRTVGPLLKSELE